MSARHPFLALSCAVILAASAATAAKWRTGIQVEQLHPFTHTAFIPVGSDISSIRFQSVRAVTAPVTVWRDFRFCEDQFREPGGSIYCPSRTGQTNAPGYRVTYSYRGQPLASDEYGNTHFTFSVLFRPEEMPNGVSAEKFAFNVSKGPSQYLAVTVTPIVSKRKQG